MLTNPPLRLALALCAAALLGLGCAQAREPLFDFYDGYTGIYNRALRKLGGVCEAPDAPCDTMPHDIEQVSARGAFIYLVPVDGGVVVVDAGFERAGRALLEAIGDRKVLAVLITHAHPDHTEAAHLMDAPVFVGRDDAAMWRGEHLPRAFFSHAAQKLIGLAPVPDDMRAVDDGFVLEVGGARFEALHIPGHTAGSVAWLYRDVAFTGDAVTNPTGRALMPTPGFTTDDGEESWRRFERLIASDVEIIVDGHYGRTDYAQGALEDALHAHREYRRKMRAWNTW